MKSKNIKKIQHSLGDVCYSTVYKWSTGINKCPPERAEQLELITGVPAAAFCWPKKYGNAWKKVEKLLDQQNDL